MEDQVSAFSALPASLARPCRTEVPVLPAAAIPAGGPSHRRVAVAFGARWVWVRINPPGIGPQVLVHVSI